MFANWRGPAQCALSQIFSRRSRNIALNSYEMRTRWIRIGSDATDRPNRLKAVAKFTPFNAPYSFQMRKTSAMLWHRAYI